MITKPLLPMSLNILLNKNAIYSLVFVDFISVTKYPNLVSFQKYDPTGYSLFMDSFTKNEENFKGTVDDYYHTKACFNPLYSTIVGAAIGAFAKGEKGDEIKVKTLHAEDEKKLLGLLTSIFYNAYDKDKILSGHNIVGYHIPFYVKRMLNNENANKVIAKDLKGEQVIAAMPAIITEHLLSKPWEQKTLDTMQVMKFGSYYNTSLEQAMYHFFNTEESVLKTGKDEVSKTYWGNVIKSVESKNSLEESTTAENIKMALIAGEYVNATMKTYQFLRNSM